MNRRSALLLSLAAIVLLSLLAGMALHRRHSTPPSTAASVHAPVGVDPDDPSPGTTPPGVTSIWAHNLRLRRGPAFRVYIPWIRGEMLPTTPGTLPSFDEPDSFVLDVGKGVIRANLGDIGNFLNHAAPSSFPLKHIQITGDGDHLELTGTMHKLLLALPIQLIGTLNPGPEGAVVLHVSKIDVLHMPVRSLLHAVHVDLADLVGRQPISGLRVIGNTLEFEPTLLPPPHLRGNLTAVSVVRPDLVLIFGDAQNDEQRESEWHNFLRVTGGTLGFGKLVMNPADLTLIDASKEPWFDLDLVHYQAQLTSGIIRNTSTNSLEVFMPSLDEQTTRPSAPAITVDWLRDRSHPLPPGIVEH